MMTISTKFEVHMIFHYLVIVCQGSYKVGHHVVDPSSKF